MQPPEGREPGDTGEEHLPRPYLNIDIDAGPLMAAREELKQIAIQSEREGSLTSTERAMIHNVVDFRNVKVRDVMVPLATTAAIVVGAGLLGALLTWWALTRGRSGADVPALASVSPRAAMLASSHELTRLVSTPCTGRHRNV